ncbi:uncharacterized protein G2W53_017281 [Senna tora]|uniref:Uncharacterized protein n=1 Tax=Senna tora TaxID=362788 RepID=A0A834WKC2_9FABA|nr:uncharacterized protein G2W53_017281 [Senna tora]
MGLDYASVACKRQYFGHFGLSSPCDNMSSVRFKQREGCGVAYTDMYQKESRIDSGGTTI